MIQIPIHLSFTSKNIKKLLSAITIDTKLPRLIGGCVRDNILNIKVNDLDIATPLKPNEVIDLLKANNIRHYLIGVKFGTIKAIIENEVFEITTLRQDVKCYGRYAEIKFSKDYLEDAKRRDFTINALSYCPKQKLLYDYFQGLEHLKEKKVIFIGKASERINEDALRILRFFRFSAHYAQELDKAGYKSCANYAHHINILSKERITQELNKIIIAPNAYKILMKMAEINIFKYITPKLKLNLKTLEFITLNAKTLNITLSAPVIYAILFSDNNIKNLEKELFNMHFSNSSIREIIELKNFFIDVKVKILYF